MSGWESVGVVGVQSWVHRRRLDVPALHRNSYAGGGVRQQPHVSRVRRRKGPRELLGERDWVGCVLRAAVSTLWSFQCRTRETAAGLCTRQSSRPRCLSGEEIRFYFFYFFVARKASLRVCSLATTRGDLSDRPTSFLSQAVGNILFSNGGRDPWHAAGGINLADVPSTPQVQVVSMPSGAHHIDLRVRSRVCPTH